MKPVSIPNIGSYVVLTKDANKTLSAALSVYSRTNFNSEGYHSAELPLYKGDWFEVSTIVLPKKHWTTALEGPIVWVKILRSKKERKFLKDRFKEQLAALKKSVISNYPDPFKHLDYRWREWIPYSTSFRGEDLEHLVWVDTQKEAIELRKKLLEDTPQVARTEFDRFTLE